ncbi:MAG: MupG family TIM beta-alpha barrel fold protein [Erysipelotrichaceae bacterium]
MARLGISIYPEHSTVEKDMAYITLAAKYGFKRIFSCLLSVEGKTKEEIVEEFRTINEHAHKCGMEVILDVAPFVFDKLGIKYDDLSLFKEMGADGMRLDEGFDSQKESMMSYNPQNLKVEINASLGTKYLDNIMSHYPNLDNIISCHNFYPQKYSGLSYAHFEKCSKDIKKLNVKVAAFVSSQNANTYGPWPVNEGLCTLEMHRDLPIDVQARHLFATRLVDDVIIANAYASEEELETLSKVNPGKLTFKVEFEAPLQETEREILYNFPHFVRGDMSEYMARSTFPRVKHANDPVPAKNTRDLKRGDVIIINEEYKRYKGELHIVLKDMPNDGRKNVIGHIPTNEIMLLDYIKPWISFGFME